MRVIGRNTQGVGMFKLKKGEQVVAFDLVAEPLEEDADQLSDAAEGEVAGVEKVATGTGGEAAETEIDGDDKE